MEMKLRKEPFEQIRSGKKKIEIRLFDEKRQTLKIGDELLFTLVDDETQRIQTTVVGLYPFKSFRNLFLSPLAGATGFDESDPDGNVQKMYAYYPPEEEARYGVLAIEIMLVK